jgi:sugar phosphate isomerase/epimerase
MKRRTFLGLAAGAAAAGASLGAKAAPAIPRPYQDGASPWPLALNTSTIRPASLDEKLDGAANAGYDGIELWVNELEEHEAAGGCLEDLGKRIQDMGLFVPNVIGLWNCMPPTEEAFQESLEATRNRMRMAAAAGSKHVAAIPAPDRPDFSLQWGVHCYRELLRIGREDYGITVAFEFVGFLKGIHRLGQAAAIALDADDPHARLVMDTFHLYRGGSGFSGIRHLSGDFIACFHWNDVPAEPAREELGDKHRIYPGGGILPLEEALRSLSAIGYSGPLSLEMFNREHWEQPAAEVARTGIEKMRGQIQRALA